MFKIRCKYTPFYLIQNKKCTKNRTDEIKRSPAIAAKSKTRYPIYGLEKNVMEQILSNIVGISRIVVPLPH